MLFISPPLTGLWLRTIPIYLLLVRAGVRRVRPAYQAEDDRLQRVYRARQLDAIHGMETVKSLGAEEGLRRRMLHDFKDVANRVARADIAAISYGGTTSFVTFLLLVLFLLVGSLEVMNGSLTIGQLVAFNSLLLLTTGPIVWLFGMWEQTQLVTVVLGRLRDILDHEGEQPLGEASALRPVPTLEGRVTLKGLGFAYLPEPDRPVLAGIDLDVLPGTTVAIVGRSGSGKSRCCDALRGCSRPRGGPSPTTAWTCAACGAWSSGATSASFRRPPTCSTTRSRATSRSARNSPTWRPCAGGGDRGRPRIRRAPSARLRDAGRRRRPAPVGRPGPARGDRALALPPPLGAAARRGHERPRLRVRARRAREHAQAARGPHGLRRRAPSEHRARRRSDRRPGGGAATETGTHEQLFAAEGLYFNLYGQQLVA